VIYLIVNPRSGGDFFINSPAENTLEPAKINVYSLPINVMNRRIIIIALMLMAAHCVMAQQLKHSRPLPGLSLTFSIITNNLDNKPQSRSSLLFTTTNNWKLPAQGWKIYFNFARQIIPATVNGGMQIQHLNGDLFCIQPGPDFKGIPMGRSLPITFTSTEWLISLTDAPDGFYLIYDKAPDVAYTISKITVTTSTTPQQLMRSPLDKIAPSSPGLTYQKNKTIRDIPVDSLIKVFPTPVSYYQNPGLFILDAGVKVVADPSFASEGEYLSATLKDVIQPLKTKVAPRGKAIILNQKPMAAEAYELTITSNSIIISASTGAGIFYGIQSLKTILPPQSWQHKQKFIAIKNLSVTDGSRFAYRAIMLDVARNFQSKREIFRLLDVMSLYKLNVLHFHLTDDEGWRIEIPELPELTSVGGKRGHTLNNQQNLQPSLGSGPDISNPSGTGYYTQADYIAILKYATQRHIRVIPEIESPGHARAAIKAMDARYNRLKKLGQTEAANEYLLHDLNDTSTYASVQHWDDNVVDVSLPSVYRFVSTITASLVKLYQQAGAPLQTIHYGGDEVPLGVWQSSPAFKQLAKADTTIHTTDDLWLYYYKNVADILTAHNLYLTAWEETGLVKKTDNGKKINILNTGLLNRDVHLEVWNNVLGWGAEDLAYKQANAGYKVILSCVSNLYFDMAAEKAFDEPGYYWGGYADVDQMFRFIPYNYFKNTTEDRMGNPLNKAYLNTKEQLTPQGQANIIGLQGALWGETLKSPQRLEYMLLPKLLGLAERAWAADPEWATTADSVKADELYNRAWSHFVNVLGKRELPRLDNYGGGFEYRIPQPGAIVQNNLIVVNSQLPGLKIRYTLDGTTPNAHSLLYTKPIPQCNSCTIKLSLFNSNNRSGRPIIFDKVPSANLIKIKKMGVD
jgi:hexosaminidase